MYTAAAGRARFVDDSLATATPSRLVTMLYDRLCLDLARAEHAQRAGDRTTANAQLQHAQDIVSALHQSLDTTWEGAANLGGLYTYVTGELVQANIANDPERTKACADLLGPLRDAWHEAAKVAAAEATTRSASLSFTA
ncbi:flagellar export chaperone FliS [Thalassiella azotivora]